MYTQTAKIPIILRIYIIAVPIFISNPVTWPSIGHKCIDIQGGTTITDNCEIQPTHFIIFTAH